MPVTNYFYHIFNGADRVKVILILLLFVAVIAVIATITVKAAGGKKQQSSFSATENSKNQNCCDCDYCKINVAGQNLTFMYHKKGEFNMQNSGSITAIKVFLIIGCIAGGFMLIPLAWCIPMTVSVFRTYNQGCDVSTGMKVCTLLFVNLVAGIIMLCIKPGPKASELSQPQVVINNYTNPEDKDKKS